MNPFLLHGSFCEFWHHVRNSQSFDFDGLSSINDNIWLTIDANNVE
jgi:hypothetical protein